MQTREEKLANWADPSDLRLQSLRVLAGSLLPRSNGLYENLHVTDEYIRLDHIEERLLTSMREDDSQGVSQRWHFKAISFTRLRKGRLTLAFPQHTFQRIQDAWGLHPRTIEVFLSNNGVFTTYHSTDQGHTSLLLKVPNLRSTGFDCVSIACDLVRRTTYVLYHHLEDEDSIFATLLATPERCIDPYFFIVALYRSHHQHVEAHRNKIDDTVLALERKTGFGHPNMVGSQHLASLNEPVVRTITQSTIQQLSYCQTDLAALGHIGRFCVECGEQVVQDMDESLLGNRSRNNQTAQQQPTTQQDQQIRQSLEILKETRFILRQEVEYLRRRSSTLLSQVQALRERAQSQTTFMLNTIAQNEAEYTAAIAVDGKRDSIAMKTIAILGIVFLPATYVATMFGMDMFAWGGINGEPGSSVRVSPSIWIYWAITVPLTIITFVAWRLWSRRENDESRKRLLVYRPQVPAGSGISAIPATKTDSVPFSISGEKMV